MTISLGKTILSAVAATLALAAPAWAHGPHSLPPKPVKNVSLSLLGASAAQGAATAEISAYDAADQRLFTTDAANNQLRVFDMSAPAAPALDFTIPLSAIGGAPNSVTYSPLCGGRIVVAEEASLKTDPGTLALFDVDGNLLDTVTTGAQPDNVVTVPGGRKFISANEGEPSDDGLVNPEGSIGIAHAEAVRRPKPRIGHVRRRPRDRSGPPLQPGSVTAAGPRARVHRGRRRSRGAGHHPGGQRRRDARHHERARHHGQGDRLQGLRTRRQRARPVRQGQRDQRRHQHRQLLERVRHVPARRDRRLPPAGDRDPRYISADEGDSRDWGYFSEESRVKSLTLDPTAFSAADKADAKLGRLTVTTTLGDTDGDGDYDQLYAFGGRGVSIYDDRGDHDWDSGDDVERYVAANDPASWNADGPTGGLDSRSDNKGPELEGIATGKVDGRDYAFAGAERNGGVFAFDLRAVPGEARIAGYVNARATATSPEGVLFVSADDSPTGAPLVITTNEVSGNVAVYSVS